MRREVDPELVAGLSFVVPGAGLACMGLWGWAIAVFISEVALTKLIGLPSGHPVITWFVLAAICSMASSWFARYHNEQLMADLIAKVDISPPPPPPPPTSGDPSERVPTPPPPSSPRLQSQPQRPPAAMAAADTPTAMRFCPSCGTRNEGHRFCPQCGSSLQAART